MPYQNKMIPGINLLYIWANVWHLNTKEWMRRCKYLVLQNALMPLLFSYTYNISSKRVICYLAIWPTLIQIRHLYCNENTNNNMPNCEHAHHCPFSIIYVWFVVVIIVFFTFCAFFPLLLFWFDIVVFAIDHWESEFQAHSKKFHGMIFELFDSLENNAINNEYIYLLEYLSIFRSYDGHFSLSCLR